MNRKNESNDDEKQPSPKAPLPVKAQAKQSHPKDKPQPSKEPWTRNEKIQLLCAAVGVGIVALMQWNFDQPTNF